MTTENHDSELQKLQLIEQALHAQTTQRAAHQGQLNEVENALRELGTTQESYRIIGNIMVRADTSKLKAELEERQSTLKARVASVEKQEEKLRAELQKLQDHILKGNDGKVR